MDTYGSFVWEPSLVKTNAITAATEAACLVSFWLFLIIARVLKLLLHDFIRTRLLFWRIIPTSLLCWQILSVDETVRNPRSQPPDAAGAGGPMPGRGGPMGMRGRGRGRGRGMRR